MLGDLSIEIKPGGSLFGSFRFRGGEDPEDFFASERHGVRGLMPMPALQAEGAVKQVIDQMERLTA